MRTFVFVVSVLSLVMSSFAAPPLPARKKPVRHGTQYLMLDLAPVANDAKPLASEGNEIQIRHIPFNLINAEKNHLYLKPIGWSAMNNEAGEYPGYMAKYDAFPAADDPTRAALRIPIHDYEAAYVLAAADDDPSLSNDLTLRFGHFAKNGRTTYQDFHVQVPRAGDKVRRGGNIWQVVPTESGNLYVVRIPINRAFAQDFQDHWEMHLDITHKIDVAVNLPDPYRFQLRPIGDPSGVRIYGMTLARPSLEMEVISDEPGNVFNLPQTPSFTIITRNHYEHYREYHFKVQAIRDDGKAYSFSFDSFRNWSPMLRVAKNVHRVSFELPEPGHYEVKFQLYRGKALVTERLTTIGMLVPNTRKYMKDSPFGVWDFGGTHGTPNDLELTGSLAHKAGWRYMRDYAKYDLIDFRDPRLHKKGVDHLIKRKQEEPDFVSPPRGLMFHETSISGPHVIRTPDIFSNVKYRMSDNDKERFDKLWDDANQAYAKAREHFPDMEVYFGNGMPHIIEEFCRRGISKDYLKVAGNECGSFMRLPETQPTDFVANNAGLWIFRQILDHYGYNDTKVYQCFEITYPNTNPGNLTKRTQAAYFIRHVMHSLSWGIPLIRVGCVTDMGNSYYHSNWGGSGFCYAYPNVSPKLSYVAFSVMTQQLDGATFSRVVPTGSTVVYAFEFKKRDGGYVTCLWTVRGTRPVTIETGSNESPAVVSMIGRSGEIKNEGGKVTVTVSGEPIFLNTVTPLGAMTLGEPQYEGPPAGERAPAVVADFGKMDAWTINREADHEMSHYNFRQPRRLGDFQYQPVSELDGRPNVLKITPQPVEGLEIQPMYNSLSLKQAAELPDRPTELGVWVHGNGGWGRVIFELEDAAGERWISLGAEMGGKPNPWMADWMPKEQFDKLQSVGKMGVDDWNSNDAWGRSAICHDGWRFVRVVMPGHYGKNSNVYHWPRNSQWRFSDDGKVTYPLKLTRVGITLRNKVLYATDLTEPADQSVSFGEVIATYAPIDQAYRD